MQNGDKCIFVGTPDDQAGAGVVHTVIDCSLKTEEPIDPNKQYDPEICMVTTVGSDGKNIWSFYGNVPTFISLFRKYESSSSPE